MSAALLVGALPAAFAQKSEPVAPAKTENAQKRQRLIKIKNVQSALVAYQLDPQHNARPLALGPLDKVAAKTDEKGTFDLPEGIEQIVSVDPQNVLLVSYQSGNDESIRRLQELIDVLDQPLRQVEIEATVVQVTPEDARDFGIMPSAGNGAMRNPTEVVAPLTAQLGYVRNNFAARLNALIADGRAKVIAAPRVTAINNMSATLGAKVEIGPLTDGKRTYNFAPSGVDLRITPTINGDDTVTLLIDAASLLKTKYEATSIVNVRDGDTMALMGFSSLFAPAGVINPPNMVIFVTARIIRRAGDDELVGPGK